MSIREKAEKVCAELRAIRQNVEGGYSEDRTWVAVVEAFGRECAAEGRADGFAHVAKSCRDGAKKYFHATHRRDWLEAMANLWDHEAAALRGKEGA